MKPPHQPDAPAQPSPADYSGRAALFIGLTVVCIGGMAVTEFAPSWAMWYWLGTAALFAATSINLTRAAGASRDEHGGDVATRVQLLHWSAVALALVLVFVLDRAEHLPPNVGSLTALLLVALGTLLAGVHFQWQLGVLGLGLLATFVAAVASETFFWILLIPSVIMIGLFFIRRHA